MASTSKLHWGIPISEYTSRENPTRYDAIPPHDDVELEIPVFHEDKLADAEFLGYYHGKFLLLPVVAVLCVLPLLFNNLVIAELTIAISLFVIVWTISRPQKRYWHYLSFPAALLFFALAYWLESPMFLLVSAIACSMWVADVFATQVVYFQTMSPTSRHQAAHVRSRWRQRFNPRVLVIQHEYYYLWFLYLTALLVIAGYWTNGYSKSGTYIGGVLLVAVLVVTCLASLTVIVAEIVSCRWFKRRWVSPLAVYRGLKKAWSQWLLYNWQMRPAVGIFRPHVGQWNHRHRLFLFMATISVAAASSIAFWTVPSWGDSFQPKSYRPSPEIKLEPYQLQMLTRLSEPEREKWEQRLLGDSANTSGNATPISDDWHYSVIGPLLLNALFAVAAGLILTFLPSLILVSRLAGRYSPQMMWMKPTRFLNATVWNDTVARLQESPNRFAKDSLFMGVNAFDNSPVLIPRSLLHDHTHIVGAAGSGKTSVALMSLMRQLIRRGDCSVVVFDLKGGDQYLFDTARRECASANQRFRWHTLQPGKSTYGFNPLLQQYLRNAGPAQKSDLLTQAMGLQHGRAYGRGFYTDNAIELTARILDMAEQSRTIGKPVEESLVEEVFNSTQNQIRSFREFVQFSKAAKLPKDLAENGAHALMVAARLADIDALNILPSAKADNPAFAESIDFAQVFRHPQTVFFHLSPGDGKEGATEIARMALFSMVNSALALRGEKRTQVYLLIDEFQLLAAPNLDIVLQLARSLGIALILANQSTADLRIPNGPDLARIVETNTRMKMHFTVSTKEELDLLLTTSGTNVEMRETHAVGSTSNGPTESLSVTSLAMPRLTANMLLAASDLENRSILRIRQGSGFAQFGGLPVIIDSPHTVEYNDFKSRESSLWPLPSIHTMPAGYREQRQSPDPPLTYADLWAKKDDAPPASDTPEDDNPDPLSGLFGDQDDD
ncbi:Type IV secretion-system coupling protein DNA-binding domain protein [Novipirellula aureliae]|uniref:Type IV secretion-system coupling protein DNA-binding domain protein n=1 Tax=Novipirellula aureliae TaxID=2527966 RepID=A0A5C6E7V8_9BACT|nr:type IV secretion system DNA-binding domain-containing protein [Novipirellula aureliae]TWU44920.1 Type IV secretion-system coupling protein DNA-binding domain protein [Novipirellula aureliae]